MCVREDRSSRLPPEFLHGQSRILAVAEDQLALLDESADERTELVQSRPASLDVLFEREREIDAFLELPPEDDERAEDEAAK